jgi:hypothetical protein
MLHAGPDKRRQMGAAAHRLAQRSFWSWDERLDAEVDAVEALVADTPARLSPIPAHG